jgi:predicted nicotinamide N-methyase
LTRHDRFDRPPAGSPGALDRLRGRFDLNTTQVSVGSHRLQIPELSDPRSYIEDRLGPLPGRTADLPFWTKVWPASLVLAAFVDSRVEPAVAPLLELCAGLGLPGLVAARNGRRAVLADFDPDALEFARAAVELNGLDDLVTVQALDWQAPMLQLDRFSTILGGETLFHGPGPPRAVELLAHNLAADGQAFLSHEERPFGMRFFRLARDRFTIRSTSCTVREPDSGRDATKVFLHALTPLPRPSEELN